MNHLSECSIATSQREAASDGSKYKSKSHLSRPKCGSCSSASNKAITTVGSNPQPSATARAFGGAHDPNHDPRTFSARDGGPDPLRASNHKGHRIPQASRPVAH